MKHIKLFEEYTQEDIEKDSMQEDDCIITANGSDYSISCGGKFISKKDEMDDALETIKSWMETNKFYPNCWFVDDHGGVRQIDTEGNFV
jgi:hypothetical protein